MGLLPVSSSRVSEPLKHQRLLFQLNADQLAIQNQYDQLSTGRRVGRISDDPAAAGRAIILQRGIGRVEQLSRNAAVTESFYQSTDDALERLDEALIEARGATVQGAQNVLSGEERSALAITIRRALESAVAAGNSMFRQHQLLGGVLQNDQALTFDQADIVFSGTDAVAQTNVGGGVLTPVGVSGNAALGLAETFYESAPLKAGLDRSTRLSDMRGGTGINPGMVRISDSGNFVDIDLRTASNLGDVVDVIGAVEFNGRFLEVSILPDGISLDFQDGLPGTLAVDDGPGDSMAKDLLIRNPLGTTAPPLVATGLAPQVTEATLLSKLNSGAGINVSAGIQIQVGNNTYPVDLAAAENVGDVLIAINRSGADVRAVLDPATGGIEIRSLRSGVDYSIGENGGLAATALGIRTANGSTKLSELDHARGVVMDAFGPEFSILRPDGVQLDFELEGAETITDVLNLIRNHPLNQNAQRVIPSLNATGNGIQLLAPPGGQGLRVQRGEVSNAAELLGFVEPGETEAVGTVSGPFALLRGRDYLPREAGGTIDTLLRLETAVRDGDIPEIERLQSRLDSDLDRSVQIRGRVGIWSQNVQTLKDTADDQAIALKAELSTEIDADLATVISELQQRQTSLEASLKLIGQTARLTLLDFL